MQNISAHSPAPSAQNNPKDHTELEIVTLLQRAATGLSDAVNLVLDLNPRAPAAAELEHALGRGLRGVSALKRLLSMGRSGAAVNTTAESQNQQAATLQASHAQSTVGLKKRRPRRHFDVDYKRQVAQLIRHNRMTISEVSKKFGLTYSAVRRWSMEFDATLTRDTAKPTMADAERIAALEDQLRQLRSDNELLKKASALFAREMATATSAGTGQ